MAASQSSRHCAATLPTSTAACRPLIGRRPLRSDSDCAWGTTCRTLSASKRTIREDRMPIRFSPQRALLLAATLASALAAFPAAAQQSTPTPPPPTPNQPTSDAATKLRGINPPPFPMAADKLPTPQLKLPKGFKVEGFVSGVPNARSLRQGDKGTIFVSNRILDKVYAVVSFTSMWARPVTSACRP